MSLIFDNQLILVTLERSYIMDPKLNGRNLLMCQLDKILLYKAKVIFFPMKKQEYSVTLNLCFCQKDCTNQFPAKIFKSIIYCCCQIWTINWSVFLTDNLVSVSQTLLGSDGLFSYPSDHVFLVSKIQIRENFPTDVHVLMFNY